MYWHGLNGTLLLPNTLETIGAHAFEGQALTEVALPPAADDASSEGGYPRSRLRAIGESAFHDVQLRSMPLPQSLTRLGASAFAGNQFAARDHSKTPAGNSGQCF